MTQIMIITLTALRKAQYYLDRELARQYDTNVDYNVYCNSENAVK